MTYPNSLVLESLGESLSNGIVVLLLDDARGSVEDTEGGFSLARLIGNAQLEKNSEQFGPRLVCPLFSISGRKRDRNISIVMRREETHWPRKTVFLLQRRSH